MNYVVAVSGGVDSVTLLDMLVRQTLDLRTWILENTGRSQRQDVDSEVHLVVAHFDHGIRPDSAKDAELVRKLAKDYGLPFEMASVTLGSEASEEEARAERYKFLQQCCKKYKAPAIVTAHHQDDLIETAILNLARGTSWRGLCSLQPVSVFQTVQLLRPLLSISKEKIRGYARSHTLPWVEDSTNIDQRYARNYIRHTIIPAAQKKDTHFKESFLAILQNTQQSRVQIEAKVRALYEGTEVLRYQLVMWPREVAKEVIYSVLTKLDPQWHPSDMQIERVLHFCKVAAVHKELRISKHLKVWSENRHLQFQKL